MYDDHIALIGGGKGFEIAERYFHNVQGRYYDVQKFEEDQYIDNWYKCLITFSSNMNKRRELFKVLRKKHGFVNMIRSNINETIGVGNIIFPNVTMDYKSEIGDNNVISANCLINHHCKIGSGCLLGPGVTMGGSVTIGNDCDIGQGVTFEPGIKVGNKVKIASGAVIMRSIPDDEIIKAKLNKYYITSYDNSRHAGL